MAEVKKTTTDEPKAADAAKAPETPSVTVEPTPKPAHEAGRVVVAGQDFVTSSGVSNAPDSRLYNGLVPQEGEYVTSVPHMVPPKYTAEELAVQDRTAPTDSRASSVAPENRQIGQGVAAQAPDESARDAQK
jgi:hypothetical protein